MPVRKQGSEAKKLDSRFRGNDKTGFGQQVLQVIGRLAAAADAGAVRLVFLGSRRY